MRIRVVDIAKNFGNMAVLAGVNLEIQDGELIALLGPSGSGKTTLLRVIAGLESSNAGRVFFGNVDATTLSVQRRRIGFVFQNYALFKHLSVFDNIAYGLNILPRSERPSKAEIRKRVQDLLDLVELYNLGDRYPGQLSGGQQQRVALARALAVEPEVLLLDEPFGAVDVNVRKDLRRWLRGLHQRTGRTTLFVTHDQEEALELAERVAILNCGKVEQIGTADELYNNPISAFVMSFLGDTSSIPVEFDGSRLSHEGQPFKAEFEGQCQRHGRLFVRPKDVAIGAPDAGKLVGTVTNVHRTVAGRRAQIALGRADTLIEAEVDLGRQIASGDRVGVSVLKGRLFPNSSPASA